MLQSASSSSAPADHTCSRHTFTPGACLCRYHYNVSSQRLDTHISYGIKDKLTMSSVASYSNMWAVVMDCDPQVRLTPPSYAAYKFRRHSMASSRIHSPLLQQWPAALARWMHTLYLLAELRTLCGQASREPV